MFLSHWFGLRRQNTGLFAGFIKLKLRKSSLVTFCTLFWIVLVIFFYVTVICLCFFYLDPLQNHAIVTSLCMHFIFCRERERGKTLWWECSYLWQKRGEVKAEMDHWPLGEKWMHKSLFVFELKPTVGVLYSNFKHRFAHPFSSKGRWSISPFPSLLFSSQVGHSRPDQTAFFYLVDGLRCRASILLRFSSSPFLWVWTWKYHPCLA